MFKKYSYIDIAFFACIVLFAGLSIYEFIRFIIPHYSFMRAATCILLVSGMYYGYKRRFEITSVTRDFEKIRGSHVGIWWADDFIRKYVDIIAYASFLVMGSIMLLSMLFNTGAILWYTLALFFIVFFTLKTYGFSINYAPIRSATSNMNMLRLFLLSFAIFFIIFKLISDSFGIPTDERALMYVGFSLLYFISGFFIFFEYKPVFRKILRPYNMLMWGLIFLLFSLLVFQNDLISMIQESRVPDIQPQELLVEEFDLPGIVSDEVSLETENINYSTQLVSNIYSIAPWLAQGSTGQNVRDLQIVLGNLQYFLWEVNGEYDEDTRAALTNALISECDWPETTRGIFGPQAKECIDNLEILVPDSSEDIDAN